MRCAESTIAVHCATAIDSVATTFVRSARKVRPVVLWMSDVSFRFVVV